MEESGGGKLEIYIPTTCFVRFRLERATVGSVFCSKRVPNAGTAGRSSVAEATPKLVLSIDSIVQGRFQCKNFFPEASYKFGLFPDAFGFLKFHFPLSPRR